MSLANDSKDSGLSQHYAPGPGLNHHSSSNLDNGDHHLSAPMDTVRTTQLCLIDPGGTNGAGCHG